MVDGAYAEAPSEFVLQSQQQINVEQSNTYIGDGYEVEFKLISQWDTSYNAEITITNTGEETIKNWLLEFELEQNIVDIWNAQIANIEETTHLVKHPDWSSDIQAGESYTFGFLTDNSFTEFPELYILSMQKVTSSEDEYEVEYEILSSWEDGFTGNIIITNKSDEMIEDWALEFDYENCIQDIWNGNIIEQEESHYVIENAGYNANIPAYDSICIGFNVYGGSLDSIIENVILTKYVIDKANDTDKMFLDDKDSDGLPDFYEQHVTYTLAETPMTDGVNSDGERDEDGDGLTNLEEFQAVTNAYLPDTDYDGISDYDEVHIYYTEPSSYDTDCDGVGDWTEIQRGTDPLNADSNFDGIIDGEDVITYGLCPNEYVLLEPEKMGYEIEITITGKGDYNDKLNLFDGTENTLFPQIQYLVGSPLLIEHEEIEFNSATLVFTLTEELCNENDIENLQIASYNENTHQIEFMNTVIDKDNNQLICETNHFSFYFLIDKMKLFKYYLSNSIDTDSVLSDVVFVIDSTGSMSSIINNTKVSIIKAATLTEEFDLDVNYGLVDYKDVIEDNYNSQFWGWYTDEESFKAAIDSFRVCDGGNEPESVVDALETARLSGYRDSAIKSIVLVTDATYREETSYSGLDSMTEEINRLIKDDITVSIIAPTYLESTYRELADKTGGDVFGINTDYAEPLVEIYTSIKDNAEKYTWVRLSDGTVVKLLVDPATASEDDQTDTDGDGVADMEELTERTELTYNGVTYTVWNYNSNPAINNNIYQDASEEQSDALTVYEMYEGIKKIESFCVTEIYEHFYTVEIDMRNAITPEAYQYIINMVTMNQLYAEIYANEVWRMLTTENSWQEIHRIILEKALEKLTKGFISVEFVSTLKDNMLASLNSNVELLAYRNVRMIDPITGEIIDIPHWAVSSIAHYNQDYYVVHFPIEMASWGGDLQTLAADVAIDAPSTTSEMKIEGYINSIFPMGDTSFGYSDLLSDVDAINCYKQLSENYISEIFESYYINLGASKRYSLFLDHYNDNFHDKINELLPDAYFDDGTIELEQKLLYCTAGVVLVENRLSDRNAPDDLWPSQVQVQILKECFYAYIYRQSALEWEN